MDISQLLIIIIVLLTVIVVAVALMTWRVIKAVEALRFVLINANNIVGDVRSLKDKVKIGTLGTAIAILSKLLKRR